jgi:hypothetical protein
LTVSCREGRPLLPVPSATGTLCGAETPSEKKKTRVVINYDAQASVESARQGRAWLSKAGLSHTMVLGVEGEVDNVSHRGRLKEANCQRNGQT